MDVGHRVQSGRAGDPPSSSACVRRRRLLQAAAVLAGSGLVGCGRRAAAPTRASTTPPVTLGVAPPLPPAEYQAALAARFSARNPGFRILYSSASAPAATQVQWWLVQSLTLSGPFAADTVDLQPALKSLNFDESVIDATLWNAFLNGSPMTALPTRLAPLLVAYWPDVFTAARVPFPGPDWTWNDFLQTCSLLRAAMKSGPLRKSGVQAVLPQMTGDQAFFRQYSRSAVSDPDLWMAFVMGYGGAVVAGGVSALNTPAAVEGVTQLVEMVGAFGSSSQAPPPNTLLLPGGVALGFQNYFPQQARAGNSAGASRFARFPRLPKRGVIPAELGGRALHNSPSPFSRPLPNLEVPSDILEAAARYFIWLYDAAQQQLLAKAGIPPIIADGGLQKAFWAQYDIDVSASDIVFPGYTWGKYAPDQWGWLGPAVADPQQVPNLLNQAAYAVDAALARERASSSGGGPAAGASAAQAAAAREFPTRGPSALATGTGR